MAMERIDKIIASQGLYSRSVVKYMVNRKRITIDGKIITSASQKADVDKNEILLDGKPFVVKKQIYLMLNKPKGYVTTSNDEKGRKKVTDLVRDVHARVYPVGRLDMDSEGLLLLTNDGTVADKLMHPRNHLEKIYHVKVRTEIAPEVITRLNEPMVIDGYKIKPVTVALIAKKDGATTLRFTLSEGRNRQIRKMCEQVGLEVMRLRRIAVGELNIGTLRPGQWRFLNHSETEYLKNL